MAGKKSDISDGAEMTFFEHLDALRPHLVRGVVVLLAVAVAAFFFKGLIIDKLLFGPSDPEFITNRLLAGLVRFAGISELPVESIDLNIVNTRMAGQFNLHMMVSLVTGLVIATPYLIWELWQFIKPALSVYERKRSNAFVMYVSACFICGLLFGYFLIVPLTVNFFAGYSASSSITNMIDVSSYLSTVLSVSLACGLLFELPVLVYFLAKMGIISSRVLKKYRRHAIVILLIIAAAITPPDIMSQIVVVIPLMALYELSIKIAVNIERGRQAEESVSYKEIYGNKIGE